MHKQTFSQHWTLPQLGVHHTQVVPVRVRVRVMDFSSTATLHPVSRTSDPNSTPTPQTLLEPYPQRQPQAPQPQAPLEP